MDCAVWCNWRGQRRYGQSLTLAQIAEREGLSVANAGKLLWILNKAGIVQSQRGTKGGYPLARPASEIRLNEVIRVLDDDTVDHFCKSHAGVLDACVHTSDCGIRPVIVGLHEIVQKRSGGNHAGATGWHRSESRCHAASDSEIAGTPESERPSA